MGLTENKLETFKHYLKLEYSDGNDVYLLLLALLDSPFRSWNLKINRTITLTANIANVQQESVFIIYKVLHARLCQRIKP